MDGITNKELIFLKDNPDVWKAVEKGTPFKIISKGNKASRIEFLEGVLLGYWRYVDNKNLVFMDV